MRAAALNTRITIQSPPTGKDGFGQAAVAWSDLATVWAEVKTVGGRESVLGQAVVGETTHRVRIRRRGDVTAAHRLLIGGQPAAIRSVTDDPNDRAATVIVVTMGSKET